MIYNADAHITNNHRKHDLNHAYTIDGEYLGHVDELQLIGTGDVIEAQHLNERVVYDRDTGRTTVYHNGNFEAPIEVYENIYAQQVVIIGMRKVA